MSDAKGEIKVEEQEFGLLDVYERIISHRGRRIRNCSDLFIRDWWGKRWPELPGYLCQLYEKREMQTAYPPSTMGYNVQRNRFKEWSDLISGCYRSIHLHECHRLTQFVRFDACAFFCDSPTSTVTPFRQRHIFHSMEFQACWKQKARL
jgi:hypothetical protein